MTLSDYFKVIESATFQLQFSVLSGLSVVEFALSQDKTVGDLLALLRRETHHAQDLYRRIRYLLPQLLPENNHSYDESIVAYLYCLNKIDMLIAYRASALIWSSEGLLWSRWLAFKILHLVQQVEQSLDASSVDGESDMFSIADGTELTNTRSLATTSMVTLVSNPDMLGSYAFKFQLQSRRNSETHLVSRVSASY